MGFDIYLRLDVEESKVFNKLLEQIPSEEKKMTTKIITSWMEEGIEKGRVAGEARLILRQLKKQIGALSDEDVKKIEAFTEEQLEKLGEDLLCFTTHNDLAVWLGKS